MDHKVNKARMRLAPALVLWPLLWVMVMVGDPGWLAGAAEDAGPPAALAQPRQWGQVSLLR